MNEIAITGQNAQRLLWKNNLLEQQNEILRQSCQDLRDIITGLQDEITRIKTDNRVLKAAIQRKAGN